MLLHTSPDNSLKNNWKAGSGRFGSGLFFVNGYDRDDAYVMTAGDYTVYAITDENEDELNIAKIWDLEVPEKIEAILDNDRSEYDFDAEDSWDAQAELLQIAIEAGYDGVETEDEQGSVYIIDGNKVIEIIEII